jgi:hypothetical protein
MLLDDRVRHRQAETRTFSHFFRREERIEDPRQQILGHARAVVVDLEDHGFLIGFVPGSEDQRAAAVRAEHRLLGVDDQVEQHLLQLMRVGEHLRQAGGQRVDDADVVQALLVGAQRQRLPNDLVHVDHRTGRVALAREREQVADDARGAFGFGKDGVEPALHLFVGIRPFDQPLAPRQDRRQRIVELMRDA